MMITKLTNKIQEAIDSNVGMKRYLESLTERVPFTERSWLYDGVNGNKFLEPDDILRHWEKILRDNLSGDNNLSALNLTEEYAAKIIQFDTAQIEKWGPQGGHAPIADLMEDIVLPSFKRGDQATKPKLFSTRLWRYAKETTIKKLTSLVGKEVLRPASYKSVVDDMRARDTLESNSGYPLFTRRNKPEVVAASISDAQSGAWKDYPAIALFRTYNGKTRLVWMYPMSTNLVEGSFFQPLSSAILNAKRTEDNAADYDFFCPWRGFEHVRAVVTKTYDTEDWHFGKQYIAASDFSATDEHFQKWASLEVFDVIKHCFQRQYWADLKQSILWMHQIPLVIGPDSIVSGDHGVSSGSNWTNFIETLFDWILGAYAYWQTNGSNGEFTVYIYPLYAIGDDQAYVFMSASTDNRSRNIFSTVKRKLARYGAEAGQEIKAEKTTAEPNSVKTLQRLFLRDYRREDGQLRGVYSTIRALKSSVYPERFHKPASWSSDMYCMRQFMILENCVDHPLFEHFVKFVCEGNRHLIPFARKSREELLKVQRRSKLVPGLNSTYNQEKRDASLGDFESIKVAAHLRAK